MSAKPCPSQAQISAISARLRHCRFSSDTGQNYQKEMCRQSLAASGVSVLLSCLILFPAPPLLSTTSLSLQRGPLPSPQASLRCESRWTRLRRRGRCLSMTVLEQVRALIERLSPLAICDDCIAEKLG